MTRYPYLLFDADNTLFDFDEANVSSFRAVCAYAGLAFTPELFACFDRRNNAAWARFDRGELTKDETLRIQFREMSEELGLELDIEGCNRVRLEVLGRSTALVPHALEVVRELKKTHRVYLITNAVESVQRGRLGRSALAPLIEEAFISETAGAAKPSVEYFDYVFAHIDGITRENCHGHRRFAHERHSGREQLWASVLLVQSEESAEAQSAPRGLRDPRPAGALRHCEIGKAPASCRRFCVISLCSYQNNSAQSSCTVRRNTLPAGTRARGRGRRRTKACAGLCIASSPRAGRGR